MAGPLPAPDLAAIRAQVEHAPGIERLRALLGEAVDAGPQTLAAILEEASRFSDGWLAPLNVRMDRAGCAPSGGRVLTAPGHAEAWKAFLKAGWPTLDQPVAFGGQDLPLVALSACQELFDRASVAFSMLPTAQRGAARLIAAHGDEAMKAEWLGKLVSGDWAATICISEPEAGSDVGRIRTLARPLDGGDWAITGEKIWISYGDHDLSPRIGHCLLARTPDAPPGGPGLSLFLVPDVLADGERNAIVVRRIEEKLGLHGSPTCALGFEGARGRLIGTEGRGLAQLFTMITAMRLAVAVQGLGIAAGAADLALAYAEERRQGGRPDNPPVPIAEHADVQRLLLGMASRVAVLRGLVLAAAVQADLARLEPDAAAREKAQALAGWLLPIAKTFGGETAFEVSSDAIQVLGGAGYVKDWPVEQYLRDARIFTIFEGTSGMQALDLLHRRLRRDDARGLRAFLALARADQAGHAHKLPAEAASLGHVLDRLEGSAAALAGGGSDAAAYPFLRLAALAATGWIALRLAALAGEGASSRLAALGRHWLQDLDAQAAVEQVRIGLGAARVEGFEAIRRRP